MSPSSVLVLLAVCVLALVTPSLGLECYQCSGSNCGDPFNTNGATFTTGNFCRKFKYTDPANNQVVMRGATNLLDQDERLKCYQETEGGFSGKMCICNTNRCNGSGTVTPGVLAITAGTLISLVMLRM